jgi:predicted methyltransferase
MHAVGGSWYVRGMSRATRSVVALAAFATLACAKADSSSIPPDVGIDIGATDASDEDEDTFDERADAPDPEAEAQAKLEKQLADRLARAEQQAAATRERFTPELQEKVAALVAKKYPSTKAALKAILASEHRTPGFSDRDVHRHPSETLTFFGLTPKMKVFEVGQGNGWYTEILAPLLARDGKLYLAGYDGDSTDPVQRFSAKSIDLFLTAPGNLYQGVELVPQGGADAPPTLGADDSLDMVLVFRMLHNFHRADRWDGFMPAVHRALKPGGVLAVVQHRAADDADPAESAAKGYLPEPWVIQKIESYGFELEKKSEINANPKDTKDHPQGVWTLPPNLALGEKDRDKYVAIGESDRSTLKFVKVVPKPTK